MSAPYMNSIGVGAASLPALGVALLRSRTVAVILVLIARRLSTVASVVCVVCVGSVHKNSGPKGAQHEFPSTAVSQSVPFKQIQQKTQSTSSHRCQLLPLQNNKRNQAP
eukprot:5080378-Amphidinium_carterae.1